MVSTQKRARLRAHAAFAILVVASLWLGLAMFFATMHWVYGSPFRVQGLFLAALSIVVLALLPLLAPDLRIARPQEGFLWAAGLASFSVVATILRGFSHSYSLREGLALAVSTPVVACVAIYGWLRRNRRGTA